MCRTGAVVAIATLVAVILQPTPGFRIDSFVALPGFGVFWWMLAYPLVRIGLCFFPSFVFSLGRLRQ